MVENLALPLGECRERHRYPVTYGAGRHLTGENGQVRRDGVHCPFDLLGFRAFEQVAASAGFVDIGFDGTGWDVVVVLVAIGSPVILVASVVLLPFAWNGRRTPSIAIVTLQLVAILPALPPYLHAPGELPPEAGIAATMGIALNLVTIALFMLGMEPRR